MSTNATNGSAATGSPSAHPPALSVVDPESPRDTEPAGPPSSVPTVEVPRSTVKRSSRPRRATPVPVWDVYNARGAVWRVEAFTEAEALAAALEALPVTERAGVYVTKRGKKK